MIHPYLTVPHMKWRNLSTGYRITEHWVITRIIRINTAATCYLTNLFSLYIHLGSFFPATMWITCYYTKYMVCCHIDVKIWLFVIWNVWNLHRFFQFFANYNYNYNFSLFPVTFRITCYYTKYMVCCHIDVKIWLFEIWNFWKLHRL